MAIQYFYPTVDVSENGKVFNETGVTSPLYQSIDEGLTSPNDSDYIYFSGTLGAGIVFFDYGNSININATRATVKTRAKTLTNNNGTIIYELYETGPNGQYTIKSTDTINISGVWTDYVLEYDGISIEYPLQNRLKLVYQASVSPTIVPAISASEIVLSGNLMVSNNHNLSIPGNVTLTTSEKLYCQDLTQGFVYSKVDNGDVIYPPLLYNNDAKSLNPKASTFDASGIFNLAYFPFSGTYNAGRAIFAEHTNKSGLVRDPVMLSNGYFLGIDDTSFFHGSKYSQSDDRIIVSGVPGTSNATPIEYISCLPSGDFSLYFRYISNYTDGTGSASNIITAYSNDNKFYLEANGDEYGPTQPTMSAYLQKPDFTYASTSITIPFSRESNGVLVTYSSGNGLGIHCCHTDGYVSSGVYSSPFIRRVTSSANSNIVQHWKYYGDVGVSEAGFSNYDIKDRVSEVKDCYYKLSDRLSRNTTIAPSGSDFHILHKIGFNQNSHRDFSMMGYPTSLSGTVRNFYDIAHCETTSYSNGKYFFRKPDDSGCVTWNFWYELDTNNVGAFSAVAAIESSGTNQPQFDWYGDRIPLYSGGIRKGSMSGYFTSSQPPTDIIAGSQINSSIFYPTIRVPSGNSFSNFKLYSSSVDLLGWNTTPTGVFSGTTLYILGSELITSGTTLYTGGYLPNTSGTTLYTAGHIPTTSGTDLYINGECFATLPLYISGPPVYSGNASIPLFIRTQYSESGVPTSGIPLYIRNFVESSGNVPLVVVGPSSAEVNGNTFPLYVSGPTVFSGDNLTGLKPCSLFIGNYFGSGNSSTTLYTRSFSDSSGNLNLVLTGGGTDYRSGNIPLYVQQHFDSSGVTTLHTLGDMNTAIVPLTILGRDYVADTNNTPLFIYSTTNSGVTAYTSLFTKSKGRDDSLPLFLRSDVDDESSDSMILYLHNDTTVNRDISLYVQNDGGVSASGVRLYVKGTGENENWYSVNGSMNLYLNAGIEGPTKSTTLYLESVHSQSSGLTLNMSGAIIGTKEMTLVIPSTVEDSSNQISLYSHGY